jgi:hypothetical protein
MHEDVAGGGARDAPLRTLNRPIVVLAVGVVAVVLNVLLYFGLFVPRLPPLISRPETPPAEHFTEPMPPSKTLLEPESEERRGHGQNRSGTETPIHPTS